MSTEIRTNEQIISKLPNWKKFRNLEKFGAISFEKRIAQVCSTMLTKIRTDQ